MVKESNTAHHRKSQEKANQYKRRLCLITNEIDIANGDEKETGDKCSSKVKQIFEELNRSIPRMPIDHAHQIANVRPNKVLQMTEWMMTTWPCWQC